MSIYMGKFINNPFWIFQPFWRFQNERFKLNPRDNSYEVFLHNRSGGTGEKLVADIQALFCITLGCSSIAMLWI